MRVFFLDLWLDLREKRLAPVAILLLAGIIAVPIVLANDEKAPPAPAPTTTTTASAAPVVQTDTQSTAVDSKLQTFSPRDPFEPTSSTATSTGSTSGTSTGSTSGTSTGTSTSTSTTGSTGSTGTSGGATTGTQPSTGTGTTGTGNSGNTTGETKTTLFTYTVDLRFGERDKIKAYKDVKRLDLIPSSDAPKIVFLGVTTTGKTAVFLVDSNIGVDTQGGKCRPSTDECTFLYLRPDSDHDLATLTDSDGTVYHLRLAAIHRVTVSSSNGTTNTGSGNGNSNSNSKNRSNAFTGRADSNGDTGDSGTTGTDGAAPPGEPDHQSNFQQFFADGGGGH